MLGAGDAFMGGFLRGWLRGEPLETCATWANACGAFAVSRLLCSPEYPTWEELQTFLAKGSPHHALRHDEALNHIHWATTRRAQPETLFALAIDHRAQLEALADAAGAPRERIAAFKRLAVQGGGEGGGRVGTAGRASACSSTRPTAARRSSTRRSCRSGSAGRWRSPARGRCASSGGAGYRLAPRRMAGDADGEVPLPSTIPTTTPALKAEQLRTLRGLYDARGGSAASS